MWLSHCKQAGVTWGMNARTHAGCHPGVSHQRRRHVPHFDTSEAPITPPGRQTDRGCLLTNVTHFSTHAQMPLVTFSSADILPPGEGHSPVRRVKDDLVPLATAKRLPAAMLGRNMCTHAPACSHAGGGGAGKGSRFHPLMSPDALKPLRSRTRLRVSTQPTSDAIFTKSAGASLRGA